jgi:hypothetical protein
MLFTNYRFLWRKKLEPDKQKPNEMIKAHLQICFYGAADLIFCNTCFVA